MCLLLYKIDKIIDMEFVSKKLLQDVLNLYTTSVKHVMWREKYNDIDGLKACAFDRIVEHLQVIIDGDFEKIDSYD